MSFVRTFGSQRGPGGPLLVGIVSDCGWTGCLLTPSFIWSCNPACL